MQRSTYLDCLFSVGGLFLLILFTGKFFYLKEFPLPLSYDESYYWDWSRHLDWGYYNKPPMVAWLIFLSTKVLGISEFAVRLPALLSLTGVQVLLYVLTFRYFGEYLARAHLFVLSFVPIFFVYSFIMTIDPPLLFFWTLSIFFLVEYLKNQTLLSAFLTGFSMGLAILTKQTAFVLPFLTFVYFMLFEKKLLSLKKTYLLLLLPFLLYLPNFYWNLKHGFVLFIHTAEHFERKGLSTRYYLKFFVGLLFLFGPIFLPFLYYYGFKYWKKFLFFLKHGFDEKIEADKVFQLKILNLFYLFSFIPLFCLLILSLLKPLNHNWIMPFFISSYFFGIYFLLQKRVTKFFYLLNLLITLGLCLFMLALPKKPDLLGKNSALLFYKFYGWKELSQSVEKHYKKGINLLASHREIASSLAFYMKAHPEVYVVNLEKRPENQYHLWRKDDELIGKEVLYVQKGIFEPKVLLNPKRLEELRLNFYGLEKSFSLWKGLYVKGEKR
ncbi:MAG: ArnT family glycosyltransferase [Caldimicrobium sp.]